MSRLKRLFAEGNPASSPDRPPTSSRRRRLVGGAALATLAAPHARAATELHGTITPNGLVYERHHGGVPEIDPDAHRLAVHGLVGEPRLFTMNDLLRLPSESRIHFIECSGNTASEWTGPSGLPV